jgi:hypothetical protein
MQRCAQRLESLFFFFQWLETKLQYNIKQLKNK